MKFKSKFAAAALEDFKDDEVADKANPNSGVDNPEPDAVPPAADPEADPEADPAADANANPDAAAGDAGADPDPNAEPEADPNAANGDGAGDPDAVAVTDEPPVENNPENAPADAAVTDVDNTGEPPTEETGELVDPEAELVEDEMTAVDDIEGEMDETTEDVEKLDIAAESLENLVAGLESAMERGGLDFAGSVLARNNMNTVTRFLNVNNLLLPALEDMETPSAKINAASTMKDSVVKFVQSIIKAIKDAAMRFADWVVQTYKRLTNANVALQARAEKLLERVKSADMKTGNIENAKLALALTAESAPVTDLPAFVAGMAKAAEFLNNPSSYSGYVTALGQCEEMLKTPEREEEIRGKISETLNKWSEDFEKHALNVTGYARSSGHTGNVGKVVNNTKMFGIPMLNNEAIYVVLPDSAEGIGYLTAVTQSLSAPTSAANVAALDKAAATKLCESIIQIAKNAQKSAEDSRGGVKELIESINKQKDTTIKMVDRLLVGKEGSDTTIRKVGIFVAKMLTSSARLPVHAINRALPRSLSAVLDLVAASTGEAAKQPEASPAKQMK